MALIKLLSKILLILSLFILQSANAGIAVSLSGWKWHAVIENLTKIKEMGFSAILLSPHTATCSGAFGGKGYDPSNFQSFDGGFGNEGELSYLIRKSHKLGIQVYADMVMNHMCAKNDYQYEHFSWNDFHHHGGINDWNNSYELEHGNLFGLHDLAHESPYVREQLWNFLVKTNNLGFDGYRLDGARHVPLWYWRDHILHSTNSWRKYVFGEIVSSDSRVLDNYTSIGMNITDYGLYDKIKEAFNFNGDLSKLDKVGLAAHNEFKAVTFIENHDVGAPQNRFLAHVFVATYPGYPFFSNPNLYDHKIKNLIWVNNHLAKGQYKNRYKSKNLLVFEREKNLIVGINQSSEWQTVWIDSSWRSSELHDHSGNMNKIWVHQNGRLNLSIPPMSYVLYAP